MKANRLMPASDASQFLQLVLLYHATVCAITDLFLELWSLAE